MYDQYEWEYSCNEVVGTPRSAATPIGRNYLTYGTDVEVAIDRTRPDGGAAQYAVWNFGKLQGQWRSKYTRVSPTSDNRVNLQTDGPQFAPSIAGRYLRGTIVARPGNAAHALAPGENPAPEGQASGSTPCVHLFGDAVRQQASYRRTGEGAGGGPDTGWRAAANPAPASSVLQACPNPSEGEGCLTWKPTPGEQVRRLRVYDALGLPTGRYPLRLDTPAGGLGKALVVE